MWSETIPVARMGAVIRTALADGALDGRGAALFHDLDGVRGRLAVLRECFPRDALHAIAIKANPVVEILRVAVESGAGLEAASIEEVHLARAAGCPPGRIIFDSPAKTAAELAEALDRGVCINADNFEELDRIARLAVGRPSMPPVGLRVNPETGQGSIAATSVASRDSRFGIALAGGRDRIQDAFRRHAWLTGLHVHVGSQGCPVALLVEGVAAVAELAVAINAESGASRVTQLDIGGGLPWSYRADQPAPDMAAYAGALRARVPAVFAPPFRLVTEFGRSLQAGCGFAVSRVEYVRQVGGIPVAVLHLGADLFLRRVYQPADWHHEFVVLNRCGEPKRGPLCAQRIAGPLCFAGDVLASAVRLPPIEEGDLVVIRDAGAYTLAMWSRHCNRGMPPVYGFEGGGSPRLRRLLRGETPADVVRSWSVERF